jgi:hypothetical protein
MAFRWEIYHPQKLVHIVAEGVCTVSAWLAARYYRLA